MSINDTFRTAPHEGAGSAGLEQALSLLSLVVLIAAAIAQLLTPVNHDAAWVLVGADRLLDGAVFGRGVVDVNPPLAWWISVVPAAIARLFDAPLGAVFKLFVMGLALISLWLSASLMVRVGFNTVWRRRILLASALALIAAPAYDFGQREHLMAILVMPWLWLCIARLDGTAVNARLGLAVAVMAACGICLKPYFLLIPVAAELAMLAMTRKPQLLFRVENLVMAGTGIVYVALVWLFAKPYLTEILPSAMGNYDAYNSPLPLVLKQGAALLGLPMLAGIFLLLRTSDVQLRRAGFVVFAAAAGAALAAIVQIKGWNYHFAPAGMFCLLALGILLSATFQPKTMHRLCAGLCVLIIAVLALRPMATFGSDMLAAGGTRDRVNALAKSIEETSTAKPGVFAFITSPRDVMPAVLQANAHWASTACCVHFVPATVRDAHGLSSNSKAKRAAREKIARAQLDGIAADLASNAPQFIIVDQARYKLGFGGLEFDWLAHANTHPPLREQLSRYRSAGEVGTFKLLHRQ